MKAAVIGAGHIARQHLDCLRALANVEISGVCDLSRTVAEAAADRFGIAAWYTDHKVMLREVRPDVVHVTTPVTSHFALSRDALEAGAHVVLEKPATVELGEITALLEQATASKLVLLEDYNYIFNSQVQKILALIRSGDFGEVVHVEASICLQYLAPGSPFADLNAPHPLTRIPGGAIGDFLPHLASLAHAFLGEHRSVRSMWMKRSDMHPMAHDEFRALVKTDQGTASLGLSNHALPETFYLRVDGTKMRAAANLFEPRLTTERIRSTPKPLTTFLNGFAEARQVRRGAYGGLWRKISGGPGSYEGLWELLKRTYEAIESGAEPPITKQQVAAVNALIEDLRNEEYRA